MSQIYGAEHFLRMLGKLCAGLTLSVFLVTEGLSSLPSTNDRMFDTGYGERTLDPGLRE